MDAVSSSTDKSLQQNPAVRRRQMRQKVLNRIRKVNIKNKSAKSFYYFTYEPSEAKENSQSSPTTYFFNGELCEGDEQFLKQSKRSIFVSNITAGTRKSEIKQLFDKYGRVRSIQLKTRSGETIVGRQHISPYSPIVAIIKFSKKEEAERACVANNGKFQAKMMDQNYHYEKQNCIRIENVEPKITKPELREYFTPFGDILSISLETNDGSLILTDNEYLTLSYFSCYVRFNRRNEAKAARAMDEFMFRDRRLRVELAYQKHCDPNKMSNNVLRMFFQNVGEVIALDQIPHQHIGYVCYKNPLPVETIKRLNQRIYRDKRIHFEKLDIGNVLKGYKQPKTEVGPSDGTDVGCTDNSGATTAPTGPATKKSKIKSAKKIGSAATGGPAEPLKKKVQRKGAAQAQQTKK